MTERDISNVMLDVPHWFDVEGQHFAFFPPTLGKVRINAQLMEDIGVSAEYNGIIEDLRLISKHRKEVCTLIAYNTFDKKEEVLNYPLVSERADFFMKHLKDKDIALLFQLLVQFVVINKIPEYIKFLGIDEDKQLMQRVQRAKKNNNTYVFGGKTLYGALIGSAIEKYHWTYDYVLWGISFINLQMLLADAITSIYLTDEERKGLPSPSYKKVKVTKENISELAKRFQ